MVFLAFTAHAATPLWSITASDGNAVKIVPANSTATVSYLVQNQSNKPKRLVMLPIQGVSQTNLCNLAPKTQSGSSCLLTLTINGSQLLAAGIHGGPSLCSSNADGSANLNQCYQPSLGQILNISKGAESSTVNLSANPSSSTFIINQTSSALVITNNSTNLTATNLIIIPSANISLVSSTCGSSLAPLASCSFSLTSSTLSTTSTVTVKGDNTNNIVIPVSVTALPTNLTAVGFYANGFLAAPLTYTSADTGTTWNLSSTLPPKGVAIMFFIHHPVIRLAIALL